MLYTAMTREPKLRHFGQSDKCQLLTRNTGWSHSFGRGGRREQSQSPSPLKKKTFFFGTLYTIGSSPHFPISNMVKRELLLVDIFKINYVHLDKFKKILSEEKKFFPIMLERNFCPTQIVPILLKL